MIPNGVPAVAQPQTKQTNRVTSITQMYCVIKLQDWNSPFESRIGGHFEHMHAIEAMQKTVTTIKDMIKFKAEVF